MVKNIFQGLFFVMAFGMFVSASTIYKSSIGRFERTGAISMDSTADSLEGGFIKTGGETFEIGETKDIKSLNGAFILDASTTTTAGFGLLDTSVIYLRTVGLGFASTILDTVRQLGLPCTLWVNLANVNDTLFKGYMELEWAVYDTSGGRTVISSADPYNMRWYMIGRN